MNRIPAIKSVMTPFPYSVALETSVADAGALMHTHQIRHLPVIDQRQLIGIVTDHDIAWLQGIGNQLGVGKNATVADVYTPHPIIVDLNERLDNVVMMMAERHLSSVIVTKRGQLAGIFTATDACLYLGNWLRKRFAPSSGGGDVA